MHRFLVQYLDECFKHQFIEVDCNKDSVVDARRALLQHLEESKQPEPLAILSITPFDIEDLMS